MRGIEFISDVGYADVINEVLTAIPLSNYDFFISEDEVLVNYKTFEFSHKVSAEIFENLKKLSPYYVLSINLQAYPKGKLPQSITTYEDFLKSDCQFILLIIDGRYFEIYVKEEGLLMRFIKNAITLKGKSIKIKTDSNDGRIHLSIRQFVCTFLYRKND